MGHLLRDKPLVQDIFQAEQGKLIQEHPEGCFGGSRRYAST